ncbi:cystathionine gamma-lyase-like [Pomacea canaliculata]|uniref:cystathionine gamma-lyase-like n=1 Tax=Pomacea canaliculata TaxID=400727 RepID=UPI000D729115|nr:cystathionine gamma-lyase-like [Pomacea canaliculata]
MLRPLLGGTVLPGLLWRVCPPCVHVTSQVRSSARSRLCSGFTWLRVSSTMADGQTFTPFPHFATDAIHEGQEPEQWKSMAVVPPISTATTFKQFAPAEHAGFEYSRSGNPTRNCLEKCLAALEGGKHGLCFSSGLATTMTVTHLLKSGDHVISMDDVYGGTNRYFRNCALPMGIDISFVDCTKIANVENALRPDTKMVWLETPTNPTMKLVDIEAVCKLVHDKSQAFVVVDNTFMSSYFQRPLSLGADMVMHSVTKYMNGHSDVVMGALMLNDDKKAERLRFLQNALGPVPSPFDCYLVNRGLKTLALRMRQHMIGGLAVARFLEASPRVLKVMHPGLESHPQYELAKCQMKGFSGMVTFLIKGGKEEASTFLKSLKIFTLAESLGGYESLCELPSVQTHASVPADQRELLGITDNLVRLSVGLEDIEDLINDIDVALKVAIP